MEQPTDLRSLMPALKMRTLQVGDKPTRLALAIAEIGRIDKTIHMLNYIHDESCRRVYCYSLTAVLHK
jgi:TnpA family transposase